MLKSERKASWMQARILHASRQLHFACGCPGAEHRAKLAVDLTVSMKNRPHDVPRNHVIGRFVRVTPPQCGLFIDLSFPQLLGVYLAFEAAEASSLIRASQK